MKGGNSCQLSVRRKSKVITKKRKPVKRGGIKTKKRNMKGGLELLSPVPFATRNSATRKSATRNSATRKSATGFPPDDSASSSNRDSGYQSSSSTATSSAPAPASKTKNSELDKALKEYKILLGLNKMLDIIKFLIYFIKTFKISDKASKDNQKRGEELLTELNETNKNVEKIDENETPMLFLIRVRVALNRSLQDLDENSKLKDLDENSKLIERVITELTIFNRIFDEISLKKMLNIYTLLDELRKLDIKDNSYITDFSNKSNFFKDLEKDYPTLGNLFFVYQGNPGLLFIQSYLRIDNNLEEIIKNNTNGDANTLLQKNQNIIKERSVMFNKYRREQECLTDIPNVKKGENINIKDCFETPHTSFYGHRLKGMGSICNRLDKKRKGNNPLKRKTRKRFAQAYETNCKINISSIGSPILIREKVSDEGLKIIDRAKPLTLNSSSNA